VHDRRERERRGPNTAAGRLDESSPGESHVRSSSWMLAVSVSRGLRRIRLLERLRSIEGVDFHALVEYAHDGRHRRGFSVEIPRRKNLAREADIGKGRRVAVAEPARLAFFRQMRLERLQRFQRPVLQPAVARRLIYVQLA